MIKNENIGFLTCKSHSEVLIGFVFSVLLGYFKVKQILILSIYRVSVMPVWCEIECWGKSCDLKTKI